MSTTTPLLAMWLLTAGWQPRLSVAQLRRRARYAGIRSLNGRPIKCARRDQLLAAMPQLQGGSADE